MIRELRSLDWSRSPGRSREILLIMGLVLFGMLLRAPAMGTGIWTDEALTANAVRSVDPARLVAVVVAQENNPPGYDLVIWPWTNVAGSGELALKLPSFLFGLLLIPATYALARMVASRDVALLAGVMATVAGPAINQSAEARAYALIALLGILTVGSYLRTIEGRHPWLAAICLALSGSALLYVQYTGGLLLAGLALATVLNFAVGKRRIAPATAAFCAIGLAFLPWLPVLAFHLRTAGAYQVTVPLADRPLLAIDNLGYGLPFPSSLIRSWLARGLVAAGSIVLVALAAHPAGRRSLARWATARPGGLTLVVVLGVVAGAEALATYGERHMFIVSPIVWVLASWATVWLIAMARRRWSGRSGTIQALAAVGLGLWLVASVAYAITLGAMPKSGIRTMVADERTLLQRDTLVLLAPDYLQPAYTYYLPDGPVPHGLAFWDFPSTDGGPKLAASGPEDWRDAWLAADPAVTLEHIAVLANSTSCLAFAYEPGPYGNVGLPYDRSADLLARLLERYPVVRQVAYPGRNERPDLYVFALRPGACRG